VKSSSILYEAVRSLRGAGRFAVILFAALYLLAGPVTVAAQDHDCGAEEVHDDHEDHERAGEAHEEEVSGEDHEGHGPEEEGLIRVSAIGADMAGIRVAQVGKATIDREVALPGEVGFNEDRRVHVTPRYGGIIREMRPPLGARVDSGEVIAVIESNANLTSYKVYAPLSGRIVAREGAVGAYASEGASLFVVADLSTVWVNLDVYPRHISDVKPGARVVVRGVGLDQQASGTVSYVAPVFDRDRRVALARATLSNADGRWRPGMFVRAEIGVATGAPVLAVERDAVQVLDDESVVFAPAGDSAFRSIPVTVGTVGTTHAEIRSGLDLGDAYVADGAFELKAEIVTGSLGGHAGHGH